MGWRSWYFNIFDMDESVWNATVDALVDTSRLVCVVLPARAAADPHDLIVCAGGLPGV